jgi:hypothetical protein
MMHSDRNLYYLYALDYLIPFVELKAVRSVSSLCTLL